MANLKNGTLNYFLTKDLDALENRENALKEMNKMDPTYPDPNDPRFTDPAPVFTILDNQLYRDGVAIGKIYDNKTGKVVEITETTETGFKYKDTDEDALINKDNSIAVVEKLTGLKADMSTMDANGHEYVEIGGIKWATMNIGANSVTDTGLYFQWGDTQGYAADQIGNGEGLKQFNWNTYKYATDLQNSNLTMTKYNYTDNKDTLDISDDAAAANWGGTWRMPTYKEFQTLRDSVTTQNVTNYNGSGVDGILITDKTDSSKTLFFPACGRASDSYVLYRNSGYYWHSSVGSPVIYGISLDFSSSSITWTYSNSTERRKGCPVRGVLGLEDKYATKALVEQLQSNIVQSDWNQSDSTAIDYIKNKSDISALEARIEALEAYHTT